MKKPLFYLLILAFLSVGTFFGAMAYASPGRTNKQGCHVCKSNCKRYGVKAGQLHCHKKLKGKSISYLPQSSLSCTGRDLDCKDFEPGLEAQQFFNRCNFSSTNDPMRLDADNDGLACEAN